MMNAHDLAPNFAGTIFGIVNGIANTSGFITPMVTAHFLKDGVSDRYYESFIETENV